MVTKLCAVVLFAAIAFSVLAGCQTATVATEVPATQIPPTEVPPTDTSVPPTDTPEPTDTIEPSPTAVPTNTPTAVPPTNTPLPEIRVESADVIVGVWTGTWDAPYYAEITDKGLVIFRYVKYPETVEKELYTVENGLFAWGDITYTTGEPQKCLDNPAATYEVYIAYQDNQPKTLRWVLVGEENCQPRFQFLTRKPLTWVGPKIP